MKKKLEIIKNSKNLRKNNSPEKIIKYQVGDTVNIAVSKRKKQYHKYVNSEFIILNISHGIAELIETTTKEIIERPIIALYPTAKTLSRLKDNPIVKEGSINYKKREPKQPKVSIGDIVVFKGCTIPLMVSEVKDNKPKVVVNADREFYNQWSKIKDENILSNAPNKELGMYFSSSRPYKIILTREESYNHPLYGVHKELNKETI